MYGCMCMHVYYFKSSYDLSCCVLHMGVSNAREIIRALEIINMHAHTYTSVHIYIHTYIRTYTRITVISTYFVYLASPSDCPVNRSRLRPSIHIRRYRRRRHRCCCHCHWCRRRCCRRYRRCYRGFSDRRRGYCRGYFRNYSTGNYFTFASG